MTVMTTWLGAVSNAWQESQNWSNGVPENGSGMTAVVGPSTPFSPSISAADLYGITLELSGASLTLNSVTLGGSSGGFVLDAGPTTGTATMESNITIENSVEISNNATLIILGNSADYTNVWGRQGSTLVNDGLITVDSSISVLGLYLTDLVNNGMIAGGFGVAGTVYGSGILSAAGNNEIDDSASVAVTQTVDLATSQDGLLNFVPYSAGFGTDFGGKISLIPGDSIWLNGISKLSVLGYNGSTLDLGSSSGQFDLLASGPGVAGFNLNSNGALVAVACFVSGTAIAVPGGEVTVDQLRVGDVVTLADGGTAPVVWLGHRRLDCRRHPRPVDVWPVRIVAHAFGLGRPRQDLRLSPDHAVSIEGVLIPIRYLLNGATVQQEEAGWITYWHAELPSHGVLLAEGLPAESYLDTGNRTAFAHDSHTTMAHPDFARSVWRQQGCAPLVTEGPVFDRVYRCLLAQAVALGWEACDIGDGRVRWVSPRLLSAG